MNPFSQVMKATLAATLLLIGTGISPLSGPLPAQAETKPSGTLPRLLQSYSWASEVKAAMTSSADLTAAEILAGADPNGRFADSRSLLFTAAYFGNAILFQLLLDKGADPQVRDKSGTTVLMGAAAGGSAQIVRSLLASGAEVNARAKDGWCALLAAAMSGNDEVLELLLKAGAEPWSRDMDGGTLLHYAAGSGRVPTLKLALTQADDINAARSDGWTPLTIAAFEGHDSIVSELLTRGADVDAPDSFALTPLYWALTSKHIAIAHRLLDEGASATGQHAEAGTSILHQAAKLDAPELIDKLIERGASPNLRDILGQTPLVTAIRTGYPGNVERLLAAGAKVDLPNGRGESLLHIARELKASAYQPGDYDRIIELLKAAGAQE